MLKKLFSMLITLSIILCSVLDSTINVGATSNDAAVAAALEYAHEMLDGKYDIDDSRAFGSKDGNYYNVHVFLANESWSYTINVESSSNNVISSLGNTDEEKKAITAAVNAAHEEYDGEYEVIDYSAYIFEANDSCYMILVCLEDAMFIPAYIVQKSINKVVYNAGLQDCWVGMLDEVYMSYVTLENVESKVTDGSVSYSVERDDHSLYNSANQYILAAYYDKVVVDSSYKYADEINAVINKDCEAFFGTTNLDDALEWAEVDPPDNGSCYYCCADAEVTKNDSGILSVKITTHWYVGGVSTINYYGLNFNLYTGEELNISEAFSMSDSEMADYFKTYTLQYINTHTNINWWDTDTDAKSMVNQMGIDDFLYYIQDDEVILCYSTYFLGPGSEGCITVSCPFANINLACAEAENIYIDSEADLSFDTSSLDSIVDDESANDLITSVIANMSAEEKSSIKAKDQLAYLAEEAAARAATIQVEDDIVIDNDTVSKATDTISSVVSNAESALSDNSVNVKSVRNKVRISTSKSGSVSVSKENIKSDIDIAEAVTPFGSFEFEPSAVSELTVESTGTNKISVDFNKADSTSKVTVKFPNITSDGYKAVVDADGNVIGGKYNPITDELSAKIDESGVFTVITNEKDFSDIKSQPEEVQNAIKKLASKGIIKGTSETEFSPDSPITRAEIAALIVRILDVDDPNADGGFSDVTKENWYFGSAGSSKRENIIAGYEDNTFRGTIVIPKVQITSVTARVLANRLGYSSASESVLNEYSDQASIANWARSDVALATYANMVIKRTDSSFVPNMEMTRGDAAVILEKLFDKVW